MITFTDNNMIIPTLSHQSEKKMKANSRLLFITTIVYFVSIYISDTFPGGNLLTVFPLLIMLISGVKTNKGVFKIYAKGYFAYILSFMVFCALSRLWAENSRLAIPKINSLIFIFLSMIVIVMLIYPVQDIDFLLKVIMYGGYVVCIYVFARYGLRGVLRSLLSTSRLSDTMLNANIMGMCAAYSVVINIYYIIYESFKTRDLLMIPAMLLLIASGSRKAIVVVIAGLLGLYALKNSSSRNKLSNILKVIIGIIVLAVLIYLLSKLPIFSTVTNRMNNLIRLLQGKESRSTSSAWIRLAYNRLGIQLFCKNPILGIGIGNSNIYTSAYYGHNHYLHNNYIELLACGGLVGFFIYYSIWIYLLIRFIRYRKRRNKEYDICVVLFVIHIVMDYGMVTYYSKDTYFMLLLFLIEINMMKQKNIDRILLPNKPV